MAEFYLWPRSLCYFVTLMIALCFLLQTLTTLASFYRHPRSRGRIFETLLELFVLCYVFVCSLLHGEAMQAHDMGLFAPSGYGGLRLASFIAVALFAIIVVAETGKPKDLAAIAAAILTLPIFERLTGNMFAYLYVIAILFWLIRSILTGLPRYREIKSNLSALSIKNAMDSLNTGVMFCESSGFIVLCNKRMQRLMAVITGAKRNGEQFIRLLLAGEINPDCKIIWFEGQNACLLPDGSAWLFTTTELTIKKRRYSQLTATDITERWNLTAELQSQNEELTRRRKELIETLDDLQALSRERETQRARIHAHDILGKRLTLLLRAIRSEPTPDYDLLRSLTTGLMEELQAEPTHSPKDDMDILKQTFESIGVEILFDGDLPRDKKKGKLLIDISKEAVTNAVRHGFATKVYITMGGSEGSLRMRIADNGQIPVGTINEGGGISGMRNRLEAFGGVLNVAAQPGFTLTIDVPEGDYV